MPIMLRIMSKRKLVRYEKFVGKAGGIEQDSRTRELPVQQNEKAEKNRG
jgi:hypothetical protein